MKRIALVVLCFTCLLPGCRTVVNPFVAMRPDYSQVPVELLRTASLAVETAISQGNRTFDPATVSGVRLDSDEILQAIRTRAARQEMVDDFLNTGHAFEQRNGLLNIQRTSAYKRFGTSRDRDRQALLVMGENADRWAIYEGIVKLNNYPSRGLSAVQELFHEARVANLEPGQKYQGVDGQILSK